MLCLYIDAASVQEPATTCINNPHLIQTDDAQITECNLDTKTVLQIIENLVCLQNNVLII